jgi:hypothetical protein
MVLIAATALLQAAGLLWPVERLLASPWRMHGGVPSNRLILLSLERKEGCFSPMDLGLALRGLRMLHPQRILVNGEIREEEAAPPLSGLRKSIRDTGIDLVEGVFPCGKARYRPVPLSCYDPPLEGVLSGPEVIPGSTPADGTDRYLSGSWVPLSHPEGISLFSRTLPDGYAGSLCWEALNPFPGVGPLWLLFGRFLLLPNHALLLIPPPVRSSSEAKPMTVPLDDFLLKIEEKERGTVSPGFEEPWAGSVVIVGAPEDEAAVSAISDLRQRLGVGRLPLIMQALLSLLWMLLPLTSMLLGRIAGICIASAVILCSLVAIPAGACYGMVLPWGAPLVSGMLLLILASLAGGASGDRRV